MNRQLDSILAADGDVGFRGLATRVRSSQLEPGLVAISKNIRMDESRTAQVREGYVNVSGVTLTTTLVTILVAEDAAKSLHLIGAGANIATMTTAGSTVTVTTATNWIESNPGHTVLLNLAGTFTSKTTDPTGNRVATWVSNVRFTFTLASGDSTYDVTTANDEVVGAPKLSGGAVAIYGACRFSDPNDSNNDRIIIAANDQATAVKLSDLTTAVILYPAGLSVSGPCDLLQEFDTVVLRQDGVTSWAFDPDDGSKGFGGTAQFEKLTTGTYTQPVDLSASATVDSSGKVSIAASGHLLSTGDIITVVDAATSGLTNGTEYVVSVSDANTFHFTAAVKTNGSASTVVVRHKAAVGGGYIHAPAAAWGAYVQRRVVVPYTHTSVASPARRSPPIYDELIFSDVLDHNTFDPIGGQFRLTAGTSDYIVGVQVYDADRLLVFNRNSIHYLTGVSGSLADVRSVQLTDEIGCVSRKSIFMHAGTVYFMSDSGIYGVTFADALNLRGVQIPLSEGIESEIKRINKAAADSVIGVYHDNKAWFAVPTGSSTRNNEIFIYSFLQNAWESIDSVSANNWGVVDLISARSGKINELYAVTEEGGVHQLDRTGVAQDNIANAVGQAGTILYPIPAQLRTRSYSFGTMERKAFNLAEIHVLSDTETVSDGEFSLVVEDPDQTIPLGSLTTLLGTELGQGEGGSIRVRLGNPRGFGAQIDWQPSQGRPALRAVGLRAVNTFNSATSVT